jgi:putative ABC transport system permease protein
MIPLFYAVRNLFRRLDQTILLIIGSVIVILLIMSASAINDAMENTLLNTGNPNNIIILGAGSEESVERSEVKAGVDEIIASSILGIRQIVGKPAVSPEVHFNGLITVKNSSSNQALIRGVKYQALWVHEKARIIEGNYPNTGEAMVGRLAYLKLGCKSTDLKVGNYIEFNKEKVKISGIFDAHGTVLEAEIWMPLQDLMTYTKRDTVSCVVVSTKGLDAVEELDLLSKKRLDLEIVSIPEAEYYKRVSEFYTPIRWMSWVCATLISTGALLGGLNSINAALTERKKEFGTLQAIGFKRLIILYSILQETVIISGLALIISTIIILLIGEISIPYSIGVFELNYSIAQLNIGIIATLLIAIIGALIPAAKILLPRLPNTIK